MSNEDWKLFGKKGKMQHKSIKIPLNQWNWDHLGFFRLRVGWPTFQSHLQLFSYWPPKLTNIPARSRCNLCTSGRRSYFVRTGKSHAQVHFAHIRPRGVDLAQFYDAHLWTTSLWTGPMCKTSSASNANKPGWQGGFLSNLSHALFGKSRRW